jgi:hypothetical protein
MWIVKQWSGLREDVAARLVKTEKETGAVVHGHKHTLGESIWKRSEEEGLHVRERNSMACSGMTGISSRWQHLECRDFSLQRISGFCASSGALSACLNIQPNETNLKENDAAARCKKKNQYIYVGS